MFSFIDYDKEYLDDCISKDLVSYISETDRIVEIMRYSALGGKRLRGILVLEFAEMLGEKRDMVCPYAMALEYIQSYSLIHDDLPCMDDDEMRRGKPSSHIKFGEANALLGGDALLTYAFNVISKSDHAKRYPERALRAIEILSRYSGYEGMVSGQVLDLSVDQNVTPSELTVIHKLKTAALIKAAALVGCCAAGADDDVCYSAEKYAENFGYAFQIIDDILDCTDNPEDCEDSSYVKVNGLAKATVDAKTYLEKADYSASEIGRMGYDINPLTGLLDFLKQRMNLEI